ncbi:Transcriptional regulatory protein ZraR [Tepidimonas sediminis]|uniref:Transcriptional regulatory protein ZraR n=1 Tax=Tepidimonas sediminis TaxID=2588941 RepID=A0A554WUY9_9BURK|nr:sigma-54 dependent transcriptional regulator [Tepidimonas sediminis]TSE27402.1 Transcriptional regulatory protein ZraR [Tepidimonas sediminis]
MLVDLIEDDVFMGEALTERLQLEGMRCRWWRGAQSALQAAQEAGAPDVVICDVRLGDGDGTELPQRLPAGWRQVPWIYITGFGSHALREALLARGALDFLTKPLDMDRLLRHLRALAGQRRQDPATLKEGAMPGISCPLGVSSEMRRIHSLIQRLGGHWQTVLITGESGAGKEELARCLHRETVGPDRPFVAVNTASLPDSLVEAELFGYERGAFTGANRTHRGLFEQADGGTLFLDEIGDMPLALQARLLRVLQDRRIARLGGERELQIDVRLIFATHRRLHEEVRAGRFREDLYYRINVVHLHVPPLRERPEDIGWLAQRFLAQWNQAHPGRPRRLGPLTEAWLSSQRWPGNVRELRNAIERACLLAPEEELVPAHFIDAMAPAPETPWGGEPPQRPPTEPPQGEVERLEDYLRRQERLYIEQMLARHGWQIGVTAESLGISRKNLWERMKRLGIQ